MAAGETAHLAMPRIAAAALAAALCSFTPPAYAQSPAPDVRIDWNPRPSLRFGDVLRIDFRFKLQTDWRTFSPEQPNDEGTFELHRRRAGIQGELFERVEFEIEKELREDGAWRDVYLNLRAADALEIKAGKFKIPFGREQTTGSTDLDYIYRTLASAQLAPARDIGVMAHGEPFDALQYEAGIFREDGENARITEPMFLLPGETEAEGGRSIVGRVVARIGGGRAGARPQIGVAMTSSNLPEGLNSMRGRTVFGSAFFPRVYVNGRRQRLGAEAEWTPGPVGLRAEYMRVTDQREGQGLGDRDLSDLVSHGWYVSGTWVLTGENKSGGIARPRRPLFQGGAGAIELATRYESLRFESATKEGPAFTNPRAEHIAENRDRVWTSGVNWYMNRWVKIQGNAIREAVDDLDRAPVLGRRVYWSGVVRLQLVL
jgi:phosphate-selective porin OprO and OprP